MRTVIPPHSIEPGRVDQLDRDPAARFQTLDRVLGTGLIDVTHASGAEFGFDAVRPELRALHG